MKITLNGQIKEVLNAPDLKTVVQRFSKDKTPVIAELNGKVIKNPQWENIIIKEGDTIELVAFVGGGSFVDRGSLFVDRYEQQTANNAQQIS